MNGLATVADQPLKERSSSWIGKSLEEVVCSAGHAFNHNQTVMVCQ